jgi:hypothetical protein
MKIHVNRKSKIRKSHGEAVLVVWEGHLAVF